MTPLPAAELDALVAAGRRHTDPRARALADLLALARILADLHEEIDVEHVTVQRQDDVDGPFTYVAEVRTGDGTTHTEGRVFDLTSDLVCGCAPIGPASVGPGGRAIDVPALLEQMPRIVAELRTALG